jgi:uroporphyrin-III C-methyltransferase
MLRKNWLLISLVLIILIAGVAADIFFWKHIAAGSQQQQDRWQAQLDGLSAQVTNQQTELTALQNKLSQWMRTNRQGATQQSLNEINYLLELANLYLQINRDPGNAVKSLQLAQHQLQMLGDATLLPLQQALASDLNRLNDTPPVDAAEILLKLQTLSESINRLPMVPQQPTVPSPTISTPAPAPSSAWYERFWQSLKAHFENAVVIRYRGPESSPILSADQRGWLRENMAFTLAVAQWAVLRENAALYKNSLEQVQQWLTSDYPNTGERKKILERLNELAAINIAPTLPDINASLRAAQQAQKESSMSSPPAVTTPQAPLETPTPPSSPPLLEPEKTPPPAQGVEI